MFPGESSSLPGKDGAIAVITPATATRLTLQQSWMRLDAESLLGTATQPQSHDTDFTPLAGGNPMSGLLRQ